MQSGEVLRVRTVAATHFTAACAQNAAITATLDVFGGITAGDHQGYAAGKHMRGRVREIRIVAAQNLDWDVEFWGTAIIGQATIGAENFLGRKSFTAAADAKQATGDTFFYYYANGLDISVMDLSRAGALYVRLVNRNATQKNAGATGNIEVEFGIELLQGR